MITKTSLKSCCGNPNYILSLSEPIKKFQITILQEAGYVFPDAFLKAGVFYCQKAGFIVSGTYGSKKLSCRGKMELLEEFIALLDQAIQLK
jgi:hypothetical protein